MLVGLSPRVCVLHLAILVPRLGRGCDGMIESLRVLKVCRKSAISARRVTLQLINAIVDDLAPDLINKNAVGYQSASQLLITAGDNPERLKSEASFAALCGVSPIPASSGQTRRHRLNRGGDRAANSALHIIAIARLRTDERTQAYVAKRQSEGLSKLEALSQAKPHDSDKNVSNDSGAYHWDNAVAVDN